MRTCAFWQSSFPVEVCECFVTSSLGGGGSELLWWVCLFVCLSVCLSAHTAKLRPVFVHVVYGVWMGVWHCSCCSDWWDSDAAYWDLCQTLVSRRPCVDRDCFVNIRGIFGKKLVNNVFYIIWVCWIQICCLQPEIFRLITIKCKLNLTTKMPKIHENLYHQL